MDWVVDSDISDPFFVEFLRLRSMENSTKNLANF